MKKVISILLSSAIICGLFVFPVSAQSNIYSAYLQVLNYAVEKYGEFKEQDYGNSTGVGYVKLIDFNNDGINELLYCTGKDNNGRRDENQYQYHIYTYRNGKAELLTEDSMDAHGGQANWEISLWTSNDGDTVLSKSRWADIASESEYITFYEYDGNSWIEDKDAFASVAVETEPGMYYFDYYVHGEKVSQDEYDSRLHAISRQDKTDIKWTDFSGSYLEEVGASLSDMNYWYGDRNSNNLSQWKTGDEEEILSVDNYIYYYDENPDFDGSGVGQGNYYALWMYNQQTGEKKTILPAVSFLQKIGNKIFAVNFSNSSSSDSRRLYCFDLDGSNVQFIASGIDWEIANDEKSLNVFNDRIYVGHNSRINYFEVISFNINGTDIRTEINPISGENIFTCDLYETYAVINGVTYNYNHIDERITVTLNGINIEFDQPPIIYNDRTLVPLRAIFEALGAVVEWDGNTQTVTAKKDGITITLKIGAYYFHKNSQKIDIDVPGMIVNDRTLVPVRAISEALDCNVEWDGNTKRVIIEKNFDNGVNDSDDNSEFLFNDIELEGKYLKFGTQPNLKTPLYWVILSVEDDKALLLADTTYCNLEYGCDFSDVENSLSHIYDEALNDTERSQIVSRYNESNISEKLFALSEDEYEEYAWWTDYSNYVLKFEGRNTFYVGEMGVSHEYIGNWLSVRPACYIDLTNIKSFAGDGNELYSAYEFEW